MRTKKPKLGRPFSPPEARLETRAFRLLPSEWRELERIGGGDHREGIRRLLKKKNATANGQSS